MTQAKMTRRFDARFDDQTVSKLNKMVETTGLTKSEIVRLLILKATAQSVKYPIDNKD